MAWKNSEYVKYTKNTMKYYAKWKLREHSIQNEVAEVFGHIRHSQ